MGTLAAHILQQHGGVGGIVKALRKVPPRVPLPGKPGLRICVALELFVDLQYQLRKTAVVPSRSQGVRQQRPALVQLLIKGFQYPVQNPAAQEGCLVVIQHLEVCRQGVPFPFLRQKMGVLPQQCRAEGVHRLDVRLIDSQQLAAQVLIARVLPQPPGELRGDLTPQLRRGGLGISDDEEVIHIAAVLGDVQKQPVHQHLGLSRAGSGGNQQAPAPVFHHRLLLRRQRQFCHGCPSSPCVSRSTASQNSSGRTGRI